MEEVLVVSYPYERIIVAVLAIALALFLILAIIIAFQMVRIIKRVNKLVDKAETVVDQVEEIGNAARKAVGSLAIGNALSKLSDTFLNRAKRRKGGNDA